VGLMNIAKFALPDFVCNWCAEDVSKIQA
jgi:hypothetical protein